MTHGNYVTVEYIIDAKHKASILAFCQVVLLALLLYSIKSNSYGPPGPNLHAIGTTRCFDNKTPKCIDNDVPIDEQFLVIPILLCNVCLVYLNLQLHPDSFKLIATLVRVAKSLRHFLLQTSMEKQD